MNPSFKKAVVLNETDDDPFRLSFNKDKYIKPITNKNKEEIIEKVKNEIGGENIQGVVFGIGPYESRIVIKNTIFSINEKIAFPQGDGSLKTPIPNQSLFILGIEKTNMKVLLSPKKTGSKSNEVPISIELEFHTFFKD